MKEKVDRESDRCPHRRYRVDGDSGLLQETMPVDVDPRPPEHVVVLANGSWGNSARIKKLAGAADVVIAADGAWAKAVRSGIDVDLVVGDLDSLDEEASGRLAEAAVATMTFPIDKDRTDTEIAVDLALEWKARRITICGVGGGRMDHSLAHAFLLGKRPTSGGEVRLELAAGTETAIWAEGDVALDEALPGDRISLIPVDRSVRVSTSGLRFPLSNELLHRTAARGISNEVCSLPARVCIRGGAALVIHESAAECGRAEPRDR